MSDKNAFREAQFAAAKKHTNSAIKHDLEWMKTEDIVYYNGFLDGFYEGVRWVEAHLKSLRDEGMD